MISLVHRVTGGKVIQSAGLAALAAILALSAEASAQVRPGGGGGGRPPSGGGGLFGGGGNPFGGMQRPPNTGSANGGGNIFRPPGTPNNPFQNNPFNNNPFGRLEGGGCFGRGCGPAPTKPNIPGIINDVVDSLGKIKPPPSNPPIIVPVKPVTPFVPSVIIRPPVPNLPPSTPVIINNNPSPNVVPSNTVPTNTIPSNANNGLNLTGNIFNPLVPAAKNFGNTKDPLAQAQDLDNQALKEVDDVEKELQAMGKLDPATKQKLDEIRDKLKNGTPAETAQAMQELETLLQGKVTNGQLTQQQMDNLMGKMDNALAMDDAAQTIRDLVAGTLPWPSGPMPLPGPSVPLTIIYWPGLPNGVVQVLADGTLLVGVGPDGELGAMLGCALDAGLPVISGDAVDNASNSEAEVGEAAVLLRNPEDSPGTVNYTVNGKPYSMEAGQWHELSKNASVEFDRGAGKGTERYKLADGSYKFMIKDGAWDLFSEEFEITIDNEANPCDFNFLVNGQPGIVAARQAAKISSKMPLVVRFDPGNGGQPVQKVLMDGTYAVAVNPESKGLDLLVAAEEQGPVGLPKHLAKKSPRGKSDPGASKSTPEPKGKRTRRTGATQPAIGD